MGFRTFYYAVFSNTSSEKRVGDFVAIAFCENYPIGLRQNDERGFAFIDQLVHQKFSEHLVCPHS